MAGGIEEEEGRTNQSFLTRDQHGVPRSSTQVRDTENGDNAGPNLIKLLGAYLGT